MASQRDKPHDKRSRRRWRERAAVLVMALFPLLIGVGFFAPGWVRVLATAQEADAGPRGPLVDRIGPFARRPLPAPRPMFADLTTELLDVDRIFAGDLAPIAPGASQGSGSFPRSYGDNIVLDDVGKTLPKISFQDILTDPLDAIYSDDEDEGVLPMCATAPLGNCVRFDDFTGARALEDQTPVPEPGTAALLALGLAALARRSSRI